MFALFFSLYIAMFTGTWQMFSITGINSVINDALNALGTFVTSIFGDNVTYDTLGDVLTNSATGYGYIPYYLSLIAFVLALITSIGIVVMAVKGIKRVFSIFFMPIR